MTRFLPVAAIAAGLLVASPAADAKNKKKDKPVIAKIALGDKRAKKAHASAKEPKAKTSQVTCQNTTVLPTAQNLELVRAAILCLHNQIRAQNNLPLLKDNAKLRKAAVGHSADMVGEGFFDHTSPNGDSFVDRILDAGYAKRNDGWTLGENLAWGTGDLSSAQGVMDAWMNSAGHKANILKRAYKEVGIGIKLGVPSDDGVGATITTDFGAKL
ncbi:CAP domain-containing protein [Solirubrobacter soli]|uniref:CAP domain-containing protein n=1 Tax=Solirubrobacter soli TaxID=363832 RepID=UPI00069EAE4C|nr:CAP domain-containing protein [Solirubrobacter soli]